MTELDVFVFGLLVGVVITIFCMWLAGAITEVWCSITTHSKENIEELVNEDIAGLWNRRVEE